MFLKIHKIHRKTPVPKACNFIKKETLAQEFSREFCEILKNTFFTERFWTTASELLTLRLKGDETQIILKFFKSLRRKEK